MESGLRPLDPALSLQRGEQRVSVIAVEKNRLFSRLCGCSRQFFLSYIHLGCYPKKDFESIRPLDLELNRLKDGNELQNPTKMLNPK